MIPRQRPSTDHTRALVERAQAGDRDAFGELFRLHWHEVLQIVLHRVGGNRTLAEDIAADVFERAWRNLPRFVWRSGGFGGWLTVIAANRVADHYKAATTRRTRPADVVELGYVIDPDRRTDPETVALANDNTAALDRALAGLTDLQRRVLALRFAAGHSIGETAAVIGCEASAIKSAQHRATQALRKQMGVLA